MRRAAVTATTFGRMLPLRIRFLMHDVYGPGGGVLSVVLNLAGELSSRHDVELVSVFRRRDAPVHPLPDGVSVRVLFDARRTATPSRNRGVAGWVRAGAQRVPSPLVHRQDGQHRRHNLYADLLLARYIRSVEDGVLVAMQPGISMAVARFGRPSAVRIAQEHRPFVSRPRKMQAAMLRRYSRLDALLTLTERDAQSYRARLPGPVPVVVIPNGMTPYAGPPSDHTSSVVVAAGRLRRGKGLDRLVTAWATVAAAHPDWELRIFGRGPQRPKLRRQVDELGLRGSVRLMGYSADIRPELARGSVFVLSSRAEGYPMALLEAMSCGLGVVSFDCPTGPREIITHGVDGLLVPNGDTDALADAIIAMIEDPDERRRLGAAALETARRRSEATVASRWEELFSDHLARKG